jgi:hypothetical protein
MLLLTARGNGRQGTAVKGALEGDEAIAFGRAVDKMVAPRGLDRGLDGLGAGIGEEYLVGEAGLNETLPQPLLSGDVMQIGDVPELLRLLRQRLDKLRVRVAERSHRDPAGEVEITLTRLGKEKGTFAPREGQSAAGIGRKEGRHESCVSLKQNCRPRAAASEVKVLGVANLPVNRH